MFRCKDLDSPDMSPNEMVVKLCLRHFAKMSVAFADPHKPIPLTGGVLVSFSDLEGFHYSSQRLWRHPRDGGGL